MLHKFTGLKVSRKVVKPSGLKISQKVKNPLVRKYYDKDLTPSQNLENLGLVSDANSIDVLKDSSIPDPKYKGFVGFAEISKPKKEVKLDEFQIHYAKSCIEKYNDDYESMSRNISLNYNQLTVPKLKRLCERYKDQILTTNG